LYFDNTNVEQAKRALQIEGMAQGWRDSFEAIIMKA